MGMNDYTSSTKEHSIKTHLSTEEENHFRYRSFSCIIPNIKEIEYILDFVPKLKPKKNDVLPSFFKLNGKGFACLKKNRKSKLLMETNNLYLSCPEKDDYYESDSTEETIKHKIICPFNFASKNNGICPIEPKKKLSRHFMEDEIIKVSAKSYNEYENILKKENHTLDKFEIYFLDDEDLEFMSQKAKKSVPFPKKTQLEVKSKKSSSENIVEDDYTLIRALSQNFTDSYETKNRANSILRMLEIKIDEKRKLDSSEI